MNMPAAVAERPGAATRREEAYRHILEMVVSGRVSEAEFLSEQRLAESLGMSRAPVREALQMLCTERILDAVPRAGYRVPPISLRETLDALDVRLLLEIESVRRACRNRDAGALRRVDALIAREKAVAAGNDDVHAWMRAGDEVHLGLAAMAGNAVLMREIARMLDLLRRASLQIVLASRPALAGVHHHRTLLEAVRRGDEAAAIEAMRKDVLILRDVVGAPERVFGAPGSRAEPRRRGAA